MKEDFTAREKFLLRKYLNNHCSREELNELFELLKISDTKEDHAEILEELWNQITENQPMDPERADAIFESITSAGASPNKSGRSKNLHMPGWIQVAAVISFIILICGIAHIIFEDKRITVQTDYGKTKVFWLPDSSKVTLNGNSSLSYASNWPEDSQSGNEEKPAREVWLEGEGYFEVREQLLEDANNNLVKSKFLVHTQHLQIEVLGTAFNVQRLGDKTQVVLSSGQVKLNLDEKQHQEMVMKPGDWVEYNAKANRLQQKEVNPSLYSSWKDHQLVFDNTPLQQIIQVLEDRYGFSIELEDQTLNTRKFTGKVRTNQMNLLFKALSSSFKLNIIQNNKQIIMKKQPK